MSTEIIVNLPDELRQRAQIWAEQAGRSLSDFLSEAIESSLLPLGNTPPPVESWSNDEVLAAADAFLPPDEDSRLTALLALQREGSINEHERIDLSRLMYLYQQGLVRKAAAIEEAVRRGLREPLGP